MNMRPLATAISVALVVTIAGCAQQRSVAQREETETRRDLDRERALPKDAEKLESVEVSGSRVAETKADGRLRRTEVETSQPVFVVGGNTAPQSPAAKETGFAQSANKPMPSTTVAAMPVLAQPVAPANGQYWEPSNRENYAKHVDNPVKLTAEDPVSTFSIDVDTGAYSNARRMIQHGALPPADAVRAEEFLNYFDYGYAAPRTLDTPFSVTTELASAPWNPQHKLMLVGIKGYEVPKSEIPASNLVFLIDTSGSMQTPDKIQLLKAAFKQMVPQLRQQDRVSIVVYAGSAGLILPPTSGSEHERITAALDALEAGGSTNGGAGIELAYKMAQQSFIKNGVNRVILATDGDFNVGTTNVEALKTLIADKRKSGVALTTLGFGQDNYNDEMAEQLADIGNGNHFYIDTLSEARKVLVDEMSSTMLTIAKDVKIQVEFNPAVVAEYRLIGYENRKLNREDFNNDKIDAGEIGAGHDVTALYELTMTGSGGASMDPLRYGSKPMLEYKSDELAFLRLRYKRPDQDSSLLIERPIRKSEIAAVPSERLRFAAAVAAFADTLRGATHLGAFDLDKIAELAAQSKGKDEFGYGREFVALVEQAKALQTKVAAR